MYRDIGYECIGISAQTGKNIDKVKAHLEGKTAMVLGHSGAGKSTLINALSPSLQLKTRTPFRATWAGATLPYVTFAQDV